MHMIYTPAGFELTTPYHETRYDLKRCAELLNSDRGNYRAWMLT